MPLMSAYPQLVPYSGLEMPLQLKVSGEETEVTTAGY